MPFLPLDLLISGAQKLGFTLTETQVQQLDKFSELLVEENKKFNLTRITEPIDIVNSHLLDSFTCLSAHTPPEKGQVMDLGTGAGLPGLPIRIVRPDLKIVLADSTAKKVSFVSNCINELHLERATAITARAEDLGKDKKYREKYDAVYSRALAALIIVAELSLPLVRVGGVMVCQKGADIEEELQMARPMIGQLGGEVEKISRIRIPETDIIRSLVIIRKVRYTTSAFPRPYVKILQSAKKKD